MSGSSRAEERAITPIELDELLLLYKIGKKPLAKLLGWGETTILIYTSQDTIPDNEYTRKLYLLYRNPGEYLQLLEQNKAKISRVAYEKSKRALGEQFPMKKIFALCTEIYRYTKYECSLLRLETILFWSQVVSLCFYNEPLFEDDYQPGKDGYPYKGVEERYTSERDIVALVLDVTEEAVKRVYLEADSNGALSERVKDIVICVSDAFSWYGPKALESFLNAERYRLCGPMGARRRKVVSKETLRKCYSEVFAQAKVHKMRDIEGYIRKRIEYIRKHEQEL